MGGGRLAGWLLLMHACGIEHELRYGQIRGGCCEWHCCGSEKAWAVAEGEGAALCVCS